MSEIINNREVNTKEKTDRRHILKQILRELHAGVEKEEIKKRYEGTLEKITVSELSQTEHELMAEAGIPAEQVRRFCSLHTEFFRDTFGIASHETKPQFQPGHPVHTFILENKAIDELIQAKVKVYRSQLAVDPSAENAKKLVSALTALLEVDKHYSRKENLLFPFLEKYGIFGPSNMMWRLDDLIRAAIKEVCQQLQQADWKKEQLLASLQDIIDECSKMIYREENILFPMALEKLSEDDWMKIKEEEAVIGYTLIEPPAVWQPERKELTAQGGIRDGVIQLETGVLTVEQLEQMMNHLPVDITFIDENDVVRYFSHGKERIFHRTKTVIGRTVQNCHPPHSVHIVEQLLADFKAGKKDVEDFWIPFKEKFVLIRYFAVRDANGTYKGTLEFTQNIEPIQNITGEKRLMS
ncbi:hypothetical protein SAMN05421736_10323 [Evansella caseinilytica]|uniref:DUF438 domain-containing protein n=1 Tax=Evansella caseinilytica TaxID=1503961 RepID=A0A1H3LVG8_9BACI|nr:DUF438 domain-containing protein [Evansella caseinilytica]SDY68350.1 hypothetical protein SAMN05421736_10323 [Evansella caseinilytica]